MQKDRTYHQSAIEYNDAFVEFAEKIAETVEHPEVRRWCRGIAKQHKFHAGRHRKALEKLEQGPTVIVADENGPEGYDPGDVVDVIDAPKAEGNALSPFEVVETPVVDEGPDATLAAQPVEN